MKSPSWASSPRMSRSTESALFSLVQGTMANMTGVIAESARPEMSFTSRAMTWIQNELQHKPLSGEQLVDLVQHFTDNQGMNADGFLSLMESDVRCVYIGRVLSRSGHPWSHAPTSHEDYSMSE